MAGVRQIVVTSGGTGIGKAIAAALAKAGNGFPSPAVVSRARAWRQPDQRRRSRAGFIDGTEFFRGSMTDERRQTLIAQTANGRGAVPEDIAATVLFRASPGASHITGQLNHVNGWAFGS